MAGAWHGMCELTARHATCELALSLTSCSPFYNAERYVSFYSLLITVCCEPPLQNCDESEDKSFCIMTLTPQVGEAMFGASLFSPFWHVSKMSVVNIVTVNTGVNKMAT